MVSAPVIKMEPSTECETVIVDQIDNAFTPRAPNYMNYASMMDKTPQVGNDCWLYD